MKKLIISFIVLIGITAIITGFTPYLDQGEILTITVDNESATDYKVCISCYTEQAASATIGSGSSFTFELDREKLWTTKQVNCPGLSIIKVTYSRGKYCGGRELDPDFSYGSRKYIIKY